MNPGKKFFNQCVHRKIISVQNQVGVLFIERFTLIAQILKGLSVTDDDPALAERTCAFFEKIPGNAKIHSQCAAFHMLHGSTAVNSAASRGEDGMIQIQGQNGLLFEAKKRIQSKTGDGCMKRLARSFFNGCIPSR